jgi:hypothetical protein
MSKEQENKKRDLEIRRIQLEKERKRKLNEQQKKGRPSGSRPGKED